MIVKGRFVMRGIIPNFGFDDDSRDAFGGIFRLPVPVLPSPRSVSDFMAAGADVLSTDMRVNVEDRDDAYVVEALVPGVSKEDVDVTFDDGILSIEVSHDEKSESSDRNIVYREVSHSNCVRKLRFADVDGDKISASLESGVLSVTVPKSEPEDTKTHIEID